MLLSLAEAAIALGQTQRQVRYLIKSGRLAARKEGGHWVIDSAALPLADGQRQAMAQRAATAREAVDKALAPAAKVAGGADPSGEKAKRHYSVNDFQVFQVGAALCRELRAAYGGEDPAAACLFAALLRLARGCHAFQPEEKAARFTEARELAADAVTHLLLAGDQQDAARRALADRLEQEFIPKLAALLAGQDKRTGKRRQDRFGSFFPGARSGA